jgi:hypothetical protein
MSWPESFKRVLPGFKLLVAVVALGMCPAGLPPENTAGQLAACQVELQKWKDWAATNVPKHEQLLQDYEALRGRNEQLERDGHEPSWFLISIACGFGIGRASIPWCYFDDS